MREKQELERLAQQLIEENKRLKQNVYTGQEAIIEGAKSKAESELDRARGRLKAAQESFDTDAIIEAQEAVMDAKIRAEQVKNYRPTPLQEDNFEVQTQQAQPCAGRQKTSGSDSKGLRNTPATH
jgi:hypothetical protein